MHSSAAYWAGGGAKPGGKREGCESVNQTDRVMRDDLRGEAGQDLELTLDLAINHRKWAA